MQITFLYYDLYPLSMGLSSSETASFVGGPSFSFSAVACASVLCFANK